MESRVHLLSLVTSTPAHALRGPSLQLIRPNRTTPKYAGRLCSVRTHHSRHIMHTNRPLEISRQLATQLARHQLAATSSWAPKAELMRVPQSTATSLDTASLNAQWEVKQPATWAAKSPLGTRRVSLMWHGKPAGIKSPPLPACHCLPLPACQCAKCHI